MTRLTRTPLIAKIAVCVALLALAFVIPAGAAGVVIYKKESLKEYEQQLASGQIKAVTINKKLRSLRVTLKDGSYVVAQYPRKGSKKAEAALRAKNVPLTVLKPAEANKEVVKKPVKHKLRYIAGGALVVVIALVVAVVMVDRKRKRDSEE
jgi:hypothetical protein